jgi:RNA polymerase sigma-70 factor (ECF subfamily)
MTAIEIQYKLISLEKDLNRFAYKLTADKEEARDLVQETFLKALRYCNKYSYESNFTAWTYTIMKNTFINWYRRSSRQNSFVNNTNKDLSKFYNISSESCLPDSEYFSKELVNAIETLKEEFKLPFKMYYEGFRYQEIAEKLEVKLGTVKSRIYVARKLLKEQVTR